MSPASPLPVGAEAPDFALAPAPGPDLVRLSDFRGQPVVLLFYPLAFSPSCTDEICTAVDDFSVWSELGVQVLGISVDQVFVLQKFAAETGARFQSGGHDGVRRSQRRFLRGPGGGSPLGLRGGSAGQGGLFLDE